MPTNKSVKIQKNKILTYSVNKPGFKTIYGTEIVSENNTININMINLQSASEPFQLGSRLFGISSFVDYFIPSGEYDLDSLKYINGSQTTGSGLSNIQVVKSTWLSQVETTLGIETPRGSSNTFIFTYNGATWDITGALTLSGQDIEDFGISFDGTATNGDVITVTETQYNKFAFFVLDSDYRTQSEIAWAKQATNTPVFPIDYSSATDTVLESATYFNDYIRFNKNISDYPQFNYCKNLGTFVLPNGIKINALLPTIFELNCIYINKTQLNWTIEGPTFSCIEKNASNVYALQTDGTFSSPQKIWGGFNSPIFEVPVM